MDTLSMCRVCLAVDVPLRTIYNTSLQDMYERLTGMPFEGKPRRPLHICYICCAKLLNCLRLQMKCLQSEKILTHMLQNNMHKPPVKHTNRFKIVHPFINISFTPDDPNISVNYDNIKKEPLELLEEIQLKEEYIEDLECTTEKRSCILAEDFLDLLKNDNTCVDEDDASDYSIQAMKSKNILVSKTPALCKTDNMQLKYSIQASELQNNPSPEDLPQWHLAQSSLTESLQSDSRKLNTNECYELNENNAKKKQNVDGPNTKSQNKDNCRKLHKCDICEQYFTFKSNLNRHMLSHNQLHTGTVRPYKCDVCEKSYIRNHDLKQHKLIHTGEKPYKCTLCGKDFSRKYYLNQHNLVHNTERQFKCNICNKYFTRKGNLIEHIRVHTGERPYKCDMCEKWFSQKSNLRKHNCLE